jgi:hypothetical protein
MISRDNINYTALTPNPPSWKKRLPDVPLHGLIEVAHIFRLQLGYAHITDFT